jgi:hypothetical protein
VQRAGLLIPIEPPYTRPPETSGYGGVRGSPHQLSLVGQPTRLCVRVIFIGFVSIYLVNIVFLLLCFEVSS